MEQTDVLMLRWPEDDHRRPEHAGQARPTLLILERGGPAPRRLGRYEDWLFEDAPPEEVALRTAIVAERAARPPAPVVEDGLLWHAGRWTVISDVQLGVTELLVARFEHVVPHAEVHAAYAAAGGSTLPGSLRSLVHRLGRRYAEVDLRIRTIRSRGFMLSAGTTADHDVPQR